MTVDNPLEANNEANRRQRPIFFLHNPKAGGSSLRSAFRSLFNPSEAAPFFCNSPVDYRQSKSTLHRHGGYAFYAGHYGYDVFRQLRAGHALITNFRDPVERIISLYRYWRNNVSAGNLMGAYPNDATVIMHSHELDFSSFIRCEDPDVRLYINNFHFRQLLNSGWENVTIRTWHKIKVRGRISAMPWFYIADKPRLSTILLKRAFPELLSPNLPFENIGRGDPIEVTSKDVEYLVSLNRFDYDIYHHALREQLARFT